MINRERRQIREREFGFNFVYFAWFAVDSGAAEWWPCASTSAVRRGMVVAAEIKPGFKLRLVAVRKHRNMPPRRGWGIGWRGWLQRFRGGGTANRRNAAANHHNAIVRRYNDIVGRHNVNATRHNGVVSRRN